MFYRVSTPTEVATAAVKFATQELTYREAIRLALEHEMDSDPSVILMGEDVGEAGGPFKTSAGLIERFGPKRVMDTPIAENSFVGVAIGMAITGLRPVVEIMFADFLAVAMDSVANEAAKYRFMSGGKFQVPLTIRAIGGAGARFGAQHSQTAESWLLTIPGLKVVAAGSPASAYGLLRSAIRDPDPVVFLEHKGLYNRRGPVQIGESGLRPLDVADVRRVGAHATIVATLLMADRAMEAADELAQHGIEVEVIELCSLVPLDLATIQQSVIKTGKLLTVEEQVRNGGWGASVVSGLSEGGVNWARKPVRLTLPDVPMPYSPVMEDEVMPQVKDIVAAARELVGT
jgi:acetoin:2,6-dichlorophenolindophenol oxidoreductase subunit beta